MNFINTLEEVIGGKAKINFVKMQQGDVLKTFADIKDLQNVCDFYPRIEFKYGLKKFIDWFRSYYLVEKTKV